MNEGINHIYAQTHADNVRVLSHLIKWKQANKRKKTSKKQTLKVVANESYREWQQRQKQNINNTFVSYSSNSNYRNRN